MFSGLHMASLFIDMGFADDNAVLKYYNCVIS